MTKEGGGLVYAVPEACSTVAAPCLDLDHSQLVEPTHFVVHGWPCMQATDGELNDSAGIRDPKAVSLDTPGSA